MTQELLQLVLSGRLGPDDAKLVQQAAARICRLEEGEREWNESQSTIQGLREDLFASRAECERLQRRVGNLENKVWRLESQEECCECDLCVPPEFHDGFCCEQCPED